MVFGFGDKGVVVRDAHFPGRAPIDSYGNGGFRFADMSHKGSLLLLPSGIYGWEQGEDDALTTASFSRVMAETGVEFLLVGTGRQIKLLSPDVRASLKAAKLSTDTMSTGAAIRTYNIMLAESRPVAAALIAV
ncbi:Mth938-like domain-containing protein [Rhizobium sp. AAP43]|uniref:Mth938-like domain-containing protein n=1 Tax=Rhizobium sp. AAP43 TaxID=1523420 RepID=UPI0006B886C1|nr:Mth938-like domain-containing protein [Rhizobium sp. AAP43]KPF41789.1 hypothetical protein IP76_19835 [Rhizobium sp. AAP43]